MSNIKKLSTKFTAGAAIILLVVAFLIIGLVYYITTDMEKSVVEGFTGQTLFSTGYIARNIDNWLIERRSGVDTLSQILPSLPNNQARFASIDTLMGILGTPYIGFANGVFHIPTGWIPAPGWDPTVRPWYEAAMENPGYATFIPPFVDSYTGEIIIAISRYLGQIDGVDAVISADFFISEVMEMVWDTVTIEGSYAFLVDQNGRIMVHTGNQDLSPTIVDGRISATYAQDIDAYRQFINTPLGETEILRVRDATGNDWYMASHKIYQAGWTLYMAVPYYFFHTGVTARMIRVIVGTVIAGSLFLLLIKFTIDRAVANPVNRLKMAAQQIADGNLNVNLETNSQDEIGELSRYFAKVATTVKSMIDDLIKFEYEYNVNGDINYRINADKYQNSFKEMMFSSNNLVETVVIDIVDFLETLSEVNDGNFDPQIKQLPGKKAILAEAIKSTTANMIAINTEINELIEAATIKGNLHFHIDESKYKGDWKKLMIGLNQIAYAVYQPIVEIRDAMNEMAKGNFINVKITGDYAGDFLAIKDAVNLMINTTNSYLGEIAEILAAFSNGDLTRTINREYVGNFTLLKEPINQISNNLHRIINEIYAASQHVLEGAKRITSNATDLAEGSFGQAVSLEELNTSIEMIKIQTQQFADNARDANDISNKSTINAKEGNDAMKQMLNAMIAIKESSSNISTIIKDIQDIAFQTNLLSLNAAVEAARAGEHGKGFNVVAEEVRNLSSRSHDAASKTTNLIQDSIDRVESGTSIAHVTSESLRVIVENATAVFVLINNIAIAASEQADTISQVSDVLLSTANMVQDNSKFAHESAATAQELSSQSEMLQELVAYFKL